MNAAHIVSVNEFVEQARGFCSWCESSALGEKPESQALSWLCKLYAAALGLPQLEPENENGLPDLPSPLLARAKSNLARFDGSYYREYFDPDPLLEDAAVMGDVGDDMLDTYKDIRAGLLLFDQGDTTEALWHWAFLHQMHWGRHAVGAIFALHCFSIAKQD